MLKIKFINWGTDGTNTFFIKFIKKYLDSDVELCDKNPDILFCSVFGDPINNIENIKRHNCISVFFTPESTKVNMHYRYDCYMLDYIDISLGFKYLDHQKYIRFPFWITYINIDDINIGKESLNINYLKQFTIFKHKVKFCSILSRHDRDNTRGVIFNKLNKYKKVDSAGNWKRNVKYKILDGVDNKLAWLSYYKFNICCESKIDEGYVTEKLFESLVAGCIPIYIVDNINSEIEPNIFNQDVIIKFSRDNIDEAVNRIIELDRDEKLYKQFTDQLILKEGAIEYITNIYDLLAKKLKDLLQFKNIIVNL